MLVYPAWTDLGPSCHVTALVGVLCGVPLTKNTASDCQGQPSSSPSTLSYTRAAQHLAEGCSCWPFSLGGTSTVRVQLLGWTVALGAKPGPSQILHAVVDGQLQTVSNISLLAPAQLQDQLRAEPLQPRSLMKALPQGLLWLTEAEQSVFGMHGSCSCMSCAIGVKGAAQLGYTPSFMLQYIHHCDDQQQLDWV